MNAFGWMRQRPRTLASGSIFTVAAVTLAVVALTAEGFPPQKVDSHDGGVWVTNTSGQQFSRFVRAIRELDAPGPAPSTNFDVVQVGPQVVLIDQSKGAMRLIDPTVARTGDEVALASSDDVVTLNGPTGEATAAIFDPGSGKVWVSSASALPQFETKSDPAVAAGAGAAVAVDVSGTVIVVSREQHRIFSIPAHGDLSSSDLPSGVGEGARPSAPDEQLQVTAVGTRPVILDPVSRHLAVGGTVVALGPGSAPVLQQPGDDRSEVFVSSSVGLTAYPMDGGQPRTVGGQLQATSPIPAPVVVLDCAYGAFPSASGTVSQIKQCGDVPTPAQPLLGPPGSNGAAPQPASTDVSTLVYRVNRGQVVLNDRESGAVWDAQGSLERLDNWKQPDQQQENDSQTSTVTDDPQDCKTEGTNTAPVPTADGPVGARPGQPVVVAPLANDTDANCDVLALVGPPKVTAGRGQVSLVGDGRLVQFLPDPDTSGRATLSYEMSDGFNPPKSATIAIDVSKSGDNQAPKSVRKAVTVVEQRHAVSYNVINDFVDPDGDPLQVVAVTVPGGQGTARFTPDGLVTYQDAGRAVGKVRIDVTVSDGRATAPGPLFVDVRTGDVKPTAREDYAQGVVGVPIEVHPLANDSDPNEDPITLARVTQVAGGAGRAIVVPDRASGRVTVTASVPGTYVFVYEISAGPSGATGRIRVDVGARTKNHPPSAMVDVVSAFVGKVSTVDLLANDSDADGDVISVTAVSSDDSLELQLDRQRYLKVKPVVQLTGPVTLSYTLSDGSPNGIVTGTVIVRPVVGTQGVQPPIARQDVVQVRSGGAITIPVLANDLSPTGDRLVLGGIATKPTKGTVYLDGSVIRYVAGASAGQDRFDYRVVSEESGAAVAGQVRVSIVKPDINRAPIPPVVEARVYQGGEVTISLPLDGTDPDGDLSFLSGVPFSDAGNPLTVKQGSNVVKYRAVGAFTGTDRVAYRVCDAVAESACSDGVIKVGVLPRPADNLAPVTATDSLVVRPGKRVAVAVLANDVDREGDSLSFAKPPLLGGDQLKGSVEGSAVVVTAPKSEQQTRLTYRVTDGFHDPVEGSLAVTVSETAPLAAPIAVDDIVTPGELQPGSPTVTVDVLANDSDPDGTPAGLTLLAPADPQASVTPDRKLLVTLTAEPRTVVYTVRDEDGNVSAAFVALPSAHSNIPPRAITPAPALVVKAGGDALTIPLASIVTDPDGGPESLRIDSAAVKATPTSLVGPILDKKTLVYQVPKGTTDPTATIVVPVSDGGSVQTISIQIRIEAPQRPPVFTSVPIQVEEGATAPTTVDLTRLARDPTTGTGSELTYRLEGASQVGAISASVSPAGVLSVEGGAASVGTTATFRIRAGSAGAPDSLTALATFTVSIIRTTKKPPEAVTDLVPRLDEGQRYPVDVLSNDHDPFDNTPKAGLTVTQAVLISGSLDLAVGDNRVYVTSRPGFSGSAEVRYTIKDALGRLADGTISLEVWGKPTTPGTPTLIADGITKNTVALQWTPASPNIRVLDPAGTALTYWVEYQGGGSTGRQECPDTSCVIIDLKPGTPYQFRVFAETVVGRSEPSAWTDPITPDQVPPQPIFATPTFDDGTIGLSWQVPPYEGTALVSYQAYVNPSVPGFVVAAGQTSTPVTGLQNGTEYTFTLCPVNKAGTGACATIKATPYARPGAPGTVTFNQSNTVVGSKFDVSWSAAADGGDAQMKYVVTLYDAGTGAAVKTVSGVTGLSQTFDVPAAKATYLFGVRGENAWTLDRKQPAPETKSQTAQTYEVPGSVSPVAITATGTYGQIQVTHAIPSNVGPTQPAGTATYEYQVVGTSGWLALPASGIVTWANPAAAHAVSVHAVNSLGVAGPTTTSSSVIAWGPPLPPALSSSKASATSWSFCWDAAGSAQGNSIAAVQWTAYINGGAVSSGSGAATGCQQVGSGLGQTVRLDAKAVDSQGHAGTVATGPSQATDPAYKTGTVNGCPVGVACGPVNIRPAASIGSGTLGQAANGSALNAYCWVVGEAVTTGNESISSDDAATYDSRVWWRVSWNGGSGYIADIWFFRAYGVYGQNSRNAAPTPANGQSINGLPMC